LAAQRPVTWRKKGVKNCVSAVARGSAQLHLIRTEATARRGDFGRNWRGGGGWTRQQTAREKQFACVAALGRCKRAAVRRQTRGNCLNFALLQPPLLAARMLQLDSASDTTHSRRPAAKRPQAPPLLPRACFTCRSVRSIRILAASRRTSNAVSHVSARIRARCAQLLACKWLHRAKNVKAAACPSPPP
jgi:hypothetical protein